MSIVQKAALLLKNNVVPLILGLLVLVSAIAGAWQNAEIGLYDTWFNVRGPQDPGQKIVIIGIDEKSEKELGPLPWPRKYHAKLLEQLAKARVVSFDVVFDASTDQENDAALAQAIRKHGSVVLAAMFAFDKDEQGNDVMWVKIPYDPIMMEAAGLGFINMPSERGNIVRRVTAVDVNSLSVPMPSFSLASLMQHDGTNMTDIKIKNHKLTVGQRSFGLSGSNQLMMNYWGPPKSFKVYSYADVLKGRIPPSTFAGCIVLIGPYTENEQNDAYQTPFTVGNIFLKGGNPMPGVEIHASIIETYMTGGAFVESPPWMNILILLAAWFIIVRVSRRLSPWAGLGAALALGSVLAGLSYVSWLKAHMIVNAVAPMVMVGVNYVGVTVENFIRVEMERRKTRDVFSRYLSSNVVDQIMESGGNIELGGVKQEVSILFVDIVNFTQYSDNMDPHIALERLNDYLTVMTGCILNRAGTLDKYIGNGLMAFFGAPVFQADQAERAVLTAIEIEEKIVDLNKKWEAKGEIPLTVTVGVNTGPAVVGNVGSPERMDYTLIGEDVNLASRVDALCRFFKIRLLVCERTVAKLKDEDLKKRLYYVGEQQVKGFVKPIGVYSVSDMELKIE